MVGENPKKRDLNKTPKLVGKSPKKGTQSGKKKP
jgi:hypothetical protein